MPIIRVTNLDQMKAFAAILDGRLMIGTHGRTLSCPIFQESSAFLSFASPTEFPISTSIAKKFPGVSLPLKRSILPLANHRLFHTCIK